MSYYENRIKALESRIEEMARRERLKAIPVKAKLIDSIAELKAENERLRKAGDAMVSHIRHGEEVLFECFDGDEVINAWHAAKDGNATK